MSLRARTGKIARLPLRIREELNQRLLENEPAKKIMAWINALPETQAVLAEFQGVPIDDRNISDWRHGGYADWLRRREHVESTREMAKWSYQLAKAGGGKLSEGAAAILSGKLLEVLEAASDEDKKLNPAELQHIVSSIVSLRTAEIAQQRADTDEEKLKRKDEELKLAREKFQRDTAALVLKSARDEAVQRIASAPLDHTAQLNAVGQHLFGDLWK